MDELEILRTATLDGDLLTVGSTGQPVVSRVYDEIRKHRDSLAKTIGALALPDEDDAKPLTVAQIRAKKANKTNGTTTGRGSPPATSAALLVPNGTSRNTGNAWNTCTASDGETACQASYLTRACPVNRLNCRVGGC